MKKLMIKRMAILTCALMLLTGCAQATPVEVEGQVMNPEDTFVVLMEMNDFPEGYSDLDVGFINSEQLRVLFMDFGVPDEQILVKQDDLSLKELMNAFTWLEENTAETSTVFFYVAAHGTYIRNDLAWNSFAPKKWNALSPTNKILVVDCCMGGEFVEPFTSEALSGITYAVTSADELGWWGIEEEGLPIIGSIWTHYFVEAFESPEADINQDGGISFTEAHQFANPQVQTYMAEEVFTVQEFLGGYQKSGFDPLEKEGYPNPVFQNQLDQQIILKMLP